MIASYFKEMQGYEHLELPKVGFMLYRVFEKEFHIGHIYIEPEFRRSKRVLDFGVLAEKKAKEMGCGYLSCVVTLGLQNNKISSRLVRVYLEYGFEIMEVIGNSQIVFKKDLK